MGFGDRCLHSLLGKWFGAAPVRVVEFGRTPWDRRRYVRVSALPPQASTVVFFRHDDGSWNVFPQPKAKVPVMSAYQFAV